MFFHSFICIWTYANILIMKYSYYEYFNKKVFFVNINTFTYNICKYFILITNRSLPANSFWHHFCAFFLAKMSSREGDIYSPFIHLHMSICKYSHNEMFKKLLEAEAHNHIYYMWRRNNFFCIFIYKKIMRYLTRYYIMIS